MIAARLRLILSLLVCIPAGAFIVYARGYGHPLGLVSGAIAGLIVGLILGGVNSELLKTLDPRQNK